MTVTVNATGTKSYQASGVNYTGITVAAGSNRALVLALCFDIGSNPSAVAATWDSGGSNQAMTLIASRNATNNGKSSYLFGLVAPATGNLNLLISWTGGANVFAAAMAFNGVDQTGGVTSFPHSTSGTTATLTVTSATGNKVMACEASTVAQGTSTGTLIYDDHVSGAIINAMAQHDDGAASVSIGNTGSNSSIVATDIAAAAAGGFFARYYYDMAGAA